MQPPRWLSLAVLLFRMKLFRWLLRLAPALAAMALICSPVRAADFPLAQAQNTQREVIFGTNTGTNAAATSATFEIERGTWHTFFLTAGTTNAGSVSVVIGVSPDKTNWANVYSIVFTNTAATNTFTNVVGKFHAARAVVTGTNTAATVQYLGQ